MASAAFHTWISPQIKGLLIDITGVLYESNDQGGVPISGSIEALRNLKETAEIKIRLLTNETQITKMSLCKKLNQLGFDSVTPEMIISPGPAVREILHQRNLRPFLLVHPDAHGDYEGISIEDPNCVVLGDAADYFTYENMNKAFHVLTSKPHHEMSFFSLGYGSCYRHSGALVLDVAPFAKALEFASGIQPEIVGKPSPLFFKSAVHDMQLNPQDCVMIGDDIVSDVGGAQNCGIRGVQVRTGKFKPEWENHLQVQPDGIVDNFAEAVDLVLTSKSRFSMTNYGMLY